MTYPYDITCLICRELVGLEAVDPIEEPIPDPSAAWVRLRMSCGHAPSVPARHTTEIVALACGTSGGFATFDPDMRPTFIVRAQEPRP